MIGPGKYDQLCTEAREKAKAHGALLIIIEGAIGWGFACQCSPEILARVPAMLRYLAADIERDIGAGDTSQLFDVAREITHAAGFDWTDPRTGKTHPAPKKDAGH